MLAGLLFATHEAADRPDALTATLPFGAGTLIEHQARLLVELGATHLIILVSRLTPELLGALSRIGRRGVAVDPVRSAQEGAEKLHPLSRVVALADGLVSSVEVIALLAGEGEDTLLVASAAKAPAAFERVGGGAAWAGVARLSPARLAEVARLPTDYDPQSALLRVAEQARAAHLMIGPQALAAGHGIEHRAAALAMHGRALLGASLSRPGSWFDRWLVAPLARLALPRLIERRTPGPVLAGAGAALGSAGLAAMALARPTLGLALLLLACLPLAMGASLARFQEEPRFALAQEGALATLAAAGVLMLGRGIERVSGDRSAVILAIALVVAGALAERAAASGVRRGWWCSPPALLLLLLPFVAAGWPLLGLAAAAGYACLTIAAVVEALRRHA